MLFTKSPFDVAGPENGSLVVNTTKSRDIWEAKKGSIIPGKSFLPFLWCVQLKINALDALGRATDENHNEQA